MTVGVMTVGVLSVGVLSVGVMTVGVLSVGVMTLSRFDLLRSKHLRVFKAFPRVPTNFFLQKKILFHVDLIKMLSLISLFLRLPSYFPQNSVGTRGKALKTIVLHTKKTSDSGIKTMPLSS
jgi:hypothetical protein